jgi:hypothetical protein
MGTLHGEKCIFLLMSQSVHLRIRNISYMICKINETRHAIFKKFHPQ